MPGVYHGFATGPRVRERRNCDQLKKKEIKVLLSHLKINADLQFVIAKFEKNDTLFCKFMLQEVFPYLIIMRNIIKRLHEVFEGV
jgi:hypothetical protein